MRFWISDRAPLGALALIAIVFGVYSLAQLAIPYCVATFMGTFDLRMVFSINILGIMLALCVLAETAASLAFLKRQ